MGTGRKLNRYEQRMTCFFYILCAFFICSCGGNKTANKEKKTPLAAELPKDEVRYVKSIQLTSPGKDKMYAFNEEIVIGFESKDRFPVDSAAFYIDGQQIATAGKEDRSFTYRIPEGKTGNMTIKVMAWHPDNKRGIATTTIRVKPDQAPAIYSYEVVNVFPHDPKAYTQGLIYQDGFIYEGTGQYGESSIRKTDMQTGKTLSVLNIDSQLFGEGITIYEDKIYQITWRSRKGFIYDLKTFTLESTFNYNSEGWGITTAGDHLIMSDGSNKLYHIAPSTFNILKEVEVYDHNGRPTERTGIRRRYDLGECVADRPDCRHRSGNRHCPGRAEPARPLACHR